MEERYSRNRIYVKEEEQDKIKNTKILLGGAGIGSIIAECALRFGFETITIVDYDIVELSNLNRQNYTEADLGKPKAEVLANRLLSINTKAAISYKNCPIDEKNVSEILEGQEIAINALDFKSDIPFIFDRICKQNKIPVLHPYNLGWAGFLTTVKPDSIPLSQLSDEPLGFELRMAAYVDKYCTYWGIPNHWLGGIIKACKDEQEALPPPQLAIASWIAAAFCVHVMYDLVIGQEIKTFPKFYLSSVLNDNH